MRALLVEDEALVALIAEEALRGFGFDVTVAATGQAALDAFSASRPDLVIVDIGLPDMRGDDVAAALRLQAADTPLLIASGYDPAEAGARFDGDPRVDVISKPYTEGDLADAIRRLGFPVSG